MTLPFAGLGAIIAALLETTVLPEMRIGGTQPDLVFALAVAATVVLRAEDGLVWAFVGGLMLDMLIPARPIGATTLSLLLMVGLAALGAHFMGQARRATAVLAAFVLTWLFQLVLLGVLMLSEGLALGVFEPPLVLVAALLNALIAIAAALVFGAISRRLAGDRADW